MRTSRERTGTAGVALLYIGPLLGFVALSATEKLSRTVWRHDDCIYLGLLFILNKRYIDPATCLAPDENSFIHQLRSLD